MKRKDDFFEGLADFEEEVPESKKIKMSEDDLGMTVEHALGKPNGEDAMPESTGALER